MVIQIPKIIQVSELRKNLARYLGEVAQGPLVVVAKKNEDARVIVSARLYNTLVEAYQNTHDAHELMELVQADTGERISWNDIRSKK